MVFFYQIRGGPCKGELSHITLRTEDIVCYVGRDKHENEDLIKYGWPGDVWFHVDGLSSAHVYFRLNYAVAASHHTNQIPLNGVIPIDLLPDDSVEDMKQIVKHNSIQGCKLSSCKIVWTPHTNLRKDFDMEAGSVSYRDTRLCRYGRCHKDRDRIKALEKTKSRDRTDIDLYGEMKNNERALIERRKRYERHVAATAIPSSSTTTTMMMGGTLQNNDMIFDPIEADRRAMMHKETQQGDLHSGLDQGVAALESLALGRRGGMMEYTGGPSHSGSRHDHDPFSITGGGDSGGDDGTEDIPIWQRQSTDNERDYPNNETAIFLLERGYPRTTVDNVGDKNHIQALQQVWNELGDYRAALDEEIDTKELQAVREEEREVLDAIFGEDIEWFIDPETPESNNINHTILDASVPITTYEPPARYFLGSDPPPELRMEIYLARSQYPFCQSPPLLALVGGGIPQEYLYKMTQQLYQEATLKAKEEEPGDPQLFALITLVGEIWEAVVNEEGVAAAKAEKEARQARLKALREQQQAQLATEGTGTTDATTAPSCIESGAGIIKYTSEQERRAYAASVVARARHVGSQATTYNISNGDDDAATKAKKNKNFYNTGVSDASLIDDLFS